MKGVVLGLLVAGLAVAGYLLWNARHAPATKEIAVRAMADAGPAAGKKKRRRARGAVRVAMANAPGERATPARLEPEPEPEPEPIKLSAADLRSVGQGDDLSRPDVVRLDMSDGKETRELGQDEIDGVFRAQENTILDCISKARPDPESYVPGNVTVKFRIQRTGGVRGVRVDAPAILQKGGLYTCVKGVVGRLKFPAAGSSQIATYPFTLS